MMGPRTVRAADVSRGLSTKIVHTKWWKIGKNIRNSGISPRWTLKEKSCGKGRFSRKVLWVFPLLVIQLLLTNKRCEFILHFFVFQSCNSETKIHYYNDEVRYMVTILEIWISRGVFILIDAKLGANEKV